MTVKRFRFLLILAVMVIVATQQAAWAAGEGHESPSLFEGDLGNVIVTLITFLVVLFALGKFAWRPILGALKSREEFIEKSLREAREDRKAAEVRLKEYTEKLEAARKEATAIVDEGRRDAEVLKRKIEEDARAEAQAVLERAKREITTSKDTALKELYDLSAHLATDVASRILRKELSPDDHRQLISESIEQIGKIERN